MDELESAMIRLAERFRERCARERLVLEEHIRLGQISSASVRQLVHGLAGAGGTFGFHDVSACARRVELALADGSTADPSRAGVELSRLMQVLAEASPRTLAKA